VSVRIRRRCLVGVWSLFGDGYRQPQGIALTTVIPCVFFANGVGVVQFCYLDVTVVGEAFFIIKSPLIIDFIKEFFGGSSAHVVIDKF